jgi:hypothetical protein
MCPGHVSSLPSFSCIKIITIDSSTKQQRFPKVTKSCKIMTTQALFAKELGTNTEERHSDTFQVAVAPQYRCSPKAQLSLDNCNRVFS